MNTTSNTEESFNYVYAPPSEVRVLKALMALGGRASARQICDAVCDTYMEVVYVLLKRLQGRHLVTRHVTQKGHILWEQTELSIRKYPSVAMESFDPVI